MKKILVHVLMLLPLICFAGCGGGGGAGADTKVSSGAVALNIDLAKLTQSGKSSSRMGNKSVFSGFSTSISTGTITAVTATLSREGYDSITKDLTIVDNVASGVINGLAQGYWHVTANVYSGQTLLFTGSVDSNIVPNAQVFAEILFDPVDVVVDPATTGSLSLTVGLNKYPGYKKISQYVSTILQDTVAQKFYIFDSSASTVAVYNGETLVREKDIRLQNPPQTLAVDTAGGSLLLGYSSGKIYRLNVATEETILLADALISITALVPITQDYLLVCNGSDWGPSNTYKTINLLNGQTIGNNQTYWYPLSNFVFNPTTGIAYALDSGISPADMHRVAFNTTSGAITSIGDSRYHGSYGFGGLIRVINNGTRIAAASGNMFISSALTSDDITYAGNLGHPFIDLVSDDTLGNLYMLNGDNITKLLVINQESFFTTLSIDLVATPVRVFNTQNTIVVFVQSDNDYYAKIFNKQTMGLM